MVTINIDGVNLTVSPSIASKYFNEHSDNAETKNRKIRKLTEIHNIYAQMNFALKTGNLDLYFDLYEKLYGTTP